MAVAPRTRRTVLAVVLVLAGMVPLSGCAEGESPGGPPPSAPAPLGPAPVVDPTCPADPLAALPDADGGATIGTVPDAFEARGLLRCVVTAPDPRGEEAITYTITREFAPVTGVVLAALDAPDEPRPTPPEMCGSRAPDKPYLLLTDTAPVREGTRSVRPRVPDDGCGSAQSAVLSALAAAAWTTLDSRAVLVDG